MEILLYACHYFAVTGVCCRCYWKYLYSCLFELHMNELHLNHTSKEAEIARRKLLIKSKEALKNLGSGLVD